MEKIGRNEVCPCGSGKKFKKCCIQLTVVSAFNAEQSFDLMTKRMINRNRREGLATPIIRKNPEGHRKMSEIIIEFAQPLLKEAETFEDQKTVFALVAIAWNLSLYDEKTQSEQIESLRQKFFEDHGSFHYNELQQILDLFILRKEEKFSEIKRFILDWDLVKTKDGFHLNVGSTMMDVDNEVQTPKGNSWLSKISDSLFNTGTYLRKE